jgi:DNA polymerase-3 subunit alpha
MLSFASYAFNKSHAAAYALVAYQTAWLKRRHPEAFMAGLLSATMDSPEKLMRYIAACGKMGIRLLAPHINESELRFSIEKGRVRFGLLAVRNVGEGLVQEILEERQARKFTGFHDFLTRIASKRACNRRALESLIRCGALDELGANRRSMLLSLPGLMETLEDAGRRQAEGQLGFFELLPTQDMPRIEIPVLEEFAQEELLAGEKEAMGFYISGHPLQKFLPLAAAQGCTDIRNIVDAQEGAEKGTIRDNAAAKILGLVTTVKKKQVKNEQTMAFLTLEDLTGRMEVLVFPGQYEKNLFLCMEGRILCVNGKVSLQEGKEAKLLADELTDAYTMDITAPKKLLRDVPRQAKVFLRFSSETDPRVRKARQFLDVFDGKTPFIFFFRDTNTYAPPIQGEKNPFLLRMLAEICGEENIVTRDEIRQFAEY